MNNDYSFFIIHILIVIKGGIVFEAFLTPNFKSKRLDVPESLPAKVLFLLRVSRCTSEPRATESEPQNNVCERHGGVDGGKEDSDEHEYGIAAETTHLHRLKQLGFTDSHRIRVRKRAAQAVGGDERLTEGKDDECAW